MHDVNKFSVKELEQCLKINDTSDSDSDEDSIKSIVKRGSADINENIENEDKTNT